MRYYGILFVILLFTGCISSPVTYYLDATNGDDGNSGLSAESAWKTLERVKGLNLKSGERLLFKRGEVFRGELSISAEESLENPVIIDTYGELKVNPIIIGNDSSAHAVHIFNSNYLTLQNLEIVNHGNTPLPGRSGLKVECYDYGVSHNIRINNVTVRDVNGSLVKEEGGGSGILIVNGGDSILSRYENLIIENCHILRCSRNAIIWSGYYDRRNWFPNKHTIVRNNLIEQVPGDGIVPIGCDSTLIEYNVMFDSPDILPMTEAAAGIWPWSCDNTIIQFNEVSGHKAPWDAQGFDSDYNCRNTLIQYNYSHDNYGGVVLVCDNGGAGSYSCGNTGSIIRYNISIGDGIRPKRTRQGMFSPGIHIAGPVRNTLIERNIIHLNQKMSKDIDRTMVTSDFWDGYADSTCFRQNVFYTADVSRFDLTHSTNNLFDENIFVGKFENQPEKCIASNNGKLFYQKMVLERDSSGYRALRDLLTVKEIQNYKCNFVDKERIERFFTSLLAD